MSLLQRLFRPGPDPREALRPLWHRVVEISRTPALYEEDGVAGGFDAEQTVALDAKDFPDLHMDPPAGGPLGVDLSVRPEYSLQLVTQNTVLHAGGMTRNMIYV